MKWGKIATMNEHKKMRPIPPAECVENGCKERSEKCKNCHWWRCTWFYVPVNENEEQND